MAPSPGLEDYSYDKIEAESDEACVESEKGVPLGDGQKGDGGHAGNQSGEDATQGGAFPIKAQHYAGKDLCDPRVSQQQERYERGRTVNSEVQADQAERHYHAAGQPGYLIVSHGRCEEGAIEVLGEQRGGGEGEDGCGHHGGESAGAADYPQKPGRERLADDGQESHVAVLKAGNHQNGGET